MNSWLPQFDEHIVWYVPVYQMLSLALMAPSFGSWQQAQL